MNWVERDVIDRKDDRLILSGWGRVFSVALEREIVSCWQVSARE